jgi:hypothetical protein
MVLVLSRLVPRFAPVHDWSSMNSLLDQSWSMMNALIGRLSDMAVR